MNNKFFIFLILSIFITTSCFALDLELQDNAINGLDSNSSFNFYNDDGLESFTINGNSIKTESQDTEFTSIKNSSLLLNFSIYKVNFSVIDDITNLTINSSIINITDLDYPTNGIVTQNSTIFLAEGNYSFQFIDDNYITKNKTQELFFDYNYTINESLNSKFDMTINSLDYLNYTSRLNSSKVFTILFEQNINNTYEYNITSEFNSSFIKSIDFNENIFNITESKYITINITSNLSQGQQDYNITLTRKHDNEKIILPINTILTSNVSILEFTPLTGIVESIYTNDNIGLEFTYNNIGNYNASNCTFIATNGLNSGLNVLGGNFDIPIGYNNTATVSISGLSPGSYSGSILLQCYDGSDIGSTVTSVNGALYSVLVSSLPESGGGGGGGSTTIIVSDDEGELFSVDPSTINITLSRSGSINKEFLLKNIANKDINFTLEIIGDTVFSDMVTFDEKFKKISFQIDRPSGINTGEKYVEYIIKPNSNTPIGNYSGFVRITANGKIVDHNINLFIVESNLVIVQNFLGETAFLLGNVKVSNQTMLISIILIILIYVGIIFLLKI